MPISISDESVILTTAKKEDGGERMLFRIFNGAHTEKVCTLKVGESEIGLSLAPFAVKTVALDKGTLLEEYELLV